jgi:hypothetical protein
MQDVLIKQVRYTSGLLSCLVRASKTFELRVTVNVTLCSDYTFFIDRSNYKIHWRLATVKLYLPPSDSIARSRRLDARARANTPRIPS